MAAVLGAGAVEVDRRGVAAQAAEVGVGHGADDRGERGGEGGDDSAVAGGGVRVAG